LQSNLLRRVNSNDCQPLLWVSVIYIYIYIYTYWSLLTLLCVSSILQTSFPREKFDWSHRWQQCTDYTSNRCQSLRAWNFQINMASVKNILIYKILGDRRRELNTSLNTASYLYVVAYTRQIIIHTTITNLKKYSSFFQHHCSPAAKLRLQRHRHDVVSRCAIYTRFFMKSPYTISQIYAIRRQLRSLTSMTQEVLSARGCTH